MQRLPSMLPSSRPPNGHHWGPLVGPFHQSFHQLEQRLPHIQPLLLSAFDQVWVISRIGILDQLKTRTNQYISCSGSTGRQGPAPTASNAKRSSRWFSKTQASLFSRIVARSRIASAIFGSQPKQENCRRWRWRLVLTRCTNQTQQIWQMPISPKPINNTFVW